jgi:perosamine synthetase
MYGEEALVHARIMLSLVPTEHWDYSPSDMIRGMLAALSPRRTDSYIGIPGVGQCLPIRSARAAIVLALKALGSRPGTSVAVPLYCCPVVFRAIAEAGCRARFIDIDPNTYCMSATDLAVKSSEVDAVIAVHMFGNMCDLPALRKAAPGKLVIEDCAQALGSRLDGRVAGSFGDIAAFSFRSGKYISVGEGGAVHSSSADVESRLSELIEELPVPSRVDEVVHVSTTCLRSMLRTKPLWGLIGSTLWSGYNKKVDRMSQPPIVLRQIYETDRDMAIRRMAGLSTTIERQRQNADHYLRNLTLDAGMLCPETPGAFFNRLQFPLLVPTPAQCDWLAERLRQNQISTARPYKDIASIAAEHYGYNGDCPRAEHIARTVLVIPCNYALKTAEVERISACVNRIWAEVAGRQPGMSIPSIPASAITPPRSGNLEGVTEPHHFS